VFIVEDNTSFLV